MDSRKKRKISSRVKNLSTFYARIGWWKQKSFKKLLVIKVIWSSLPLGLDGRKVCNQEHISLIINGFLNSGVTGPKFT